MRSGLRSCALALFLGGVLLALSAGWVSAQTDPHPDSDPLPPLLSSQDVARDFIASWEYRWGDSPRDAFGSPTWAKQPAGNQIDPSRSDWLHLGKKAIPQPPGRNGSKWLWLRATLAGPAVEDPALYIGLVNQLCEAYVDGRLVYRFGQLDGDGVEARRFLGYPMHMIPLGNSYQGRTITLRFYSNHIAIGAGGSLRIGTKTALIRDTLRKDVGKVVVGIVLAAVGLVVFGLYLNERRERAYLFYAAFSLLLGIWMLCQMRVRHLLIGTPLVWTYVEYFALYTLVPCLIFFLVRVMGRGVLGLLPFLAWLLVAFDAGAAVLVATGSVGVMRTLVAFELGFLVLIVYVLTNLAVLIKQGNSDAKLFAAGFLVAVMSATYDVLTSISVLPRTSVALVHFGQGAFVLSLGLILVRKFRRVHQDLVATQQELSEKVQSLQGRNSEIEHLNEELRHQIEARSKQLVSSLIDGNSSSQEMVPIFPVNALISERYRVVKLLGQGAMGVVYEVERVHDGRHFAAKVLSGRTQRHELARFAREAQLLARLKHENLVSIADVDVTSSRLAYLIMELVDGSTLEAQSERFGDLRFVRPVLRQLADALAKVHAEGVVHRDLKPANILVAKTAPGAEPVIKVADFGVSALLGGNADAAQSTMPPRLDSPADTQRNENAADTAKLAAVAAAELAHTQAEKTVDVPVQATNQSAGRAARSDVLTQTGVIMGTPLYMAPELVRGAKLARTASDIFSFGIIAYELLTGRLPSETPPILMALKPLSRWFTALAIACPQLPEPIAALIERCLDVLPENRPTAAEILAALKKWSDWEKTARDIHR